MYQGTVSFITVQADVVTVQDIAKSFKVTFFPTVLILRGGKEVDRLVGAECLSTRLVRCINSHLTVVDKVQRAKHQYRIRMEQALKEGKVPDSEEEAEKCAVDWTFDPDKCGEHMRIEKDGMLVVLMDIDEVGEQIKWEYLLDLKSWSEFSLQVQQEIETAYRSGSLFAGIPCQTAEGEIKKGATIIITDEEVTGFHGTHYPDGNTVAVRRYGDRFSVPGEDAHLSKDQIARDRRTALWRERKAAQKKMMKEAKLGNDTECIRGTIGFLANTGTHTWSFVWSHEPSRSGTCDSVGLCSELREDFFATSTPNLGSNDAGASIAFYADGSFYHNGELVVRIPAARRRDELRLDSSVPIEKSEKGKQSPTSVLKEVDRLETVVTDTDVNDLTSSENVPVVTVATPAKLRSAVKKRQLANLTKEDLLRCTRKELKALAKKNNIKANLKNYVIIEELMLVIERLPVTARSDLGPTERNQVASEVTFGVVPDTPLKVAAVGKVSVKDIPRNSDLIVDAAQVSSSVASDTSSDAAVAKRSVESSLPEISTISLSPAFGKNSVVVCELDTNTNGGTLTIYLDGEKIDLLTTENVYEKLGGSELFPCISIGPIDPVLVEARRTLQRIKIVKLEEERQRLKGLNLPLPPPDELAKVVVFPEVDITELSDLVPSVMVYWGRFPSTVDISKPSSLIEAMGSCSENSSSTATLPEQPKIVEEPSKTDKPKISWMYQDGKQKWIVYSETISHYIEAHLSAGYFSLSKMVGRMVHSLNLSTMKVSINESATDFNLRRRVLADGIRGLCEQFTTNYDKPHGLSGVGAITVFENVWKNSETFQGDGGNLGFLFLYNLLSGDLRVKVTGNDYGSFTSSRHHYGSKNYGHGTVGTDSHRFATLLLQLYQDCRQTSLAASVINVLVRNRQVSPRIPKFKDTRLNNRSSFFMGWTDEIETVSPLANLFEKLVPLMARLKRQGALHFPPSPPHPELPSPSTVLKVPGNDNITSKTQFIERMIPEISDYGCAERLFQPVSNEEVEELISSTRYHLLTSHEYAPQPPICVEEARQILEFIQKNPAKVIVVHFFAKWSYPCKSFTSVYHQCAMKTPTAAFLKIDIDKCNAVAAMFKIETVPSAIIFRSAGEETFSTNSIFSKIHGAVEFVEQFPSILQSLSTPQEMAILKDFLNEVPITSKKAEVYASLSEVTALSTKPLDECNQFVVKYSRSELHLKEVNSSLAFDLSNHAAASTAPGKAVLKRFKDDVRAYSTSVNQSPLVRVASLSDADILAFFNGSPGSEVVIQQALRNVQTMIQQLNLIKESDYKKNNACIQLLV